MQMTGDKSSHNLKQVVQTSVNMSGKYMACDKVVAEHNQAELSELEAQTANSI